MTETKAELLARYRRDIATLEGGGIEAAKRTLEEARADLGRVALAHGAEAEKTKDAARAVTAATEALAIAEQRLIALQDEVARLGAEILEEERQRAIEDEIAPQLQQSLKAWEEVQALISKTGQAIRNACTLQHRAFNVLPNPGSTGLSIAMLFDPLHSGANAGETQAGLQLLSSVGWALSQATTGLLPPPRGFFVAPTRDLGQIEANPIEQRRMFAREYLRQLGATPEILASLDAAPAKKLRVVA